MKFIITILFLFPIYGFGQITGDAFLNGQSIHSGIKVKFIPNSPSAQLDSTFTAIDGSFSISIPGGIYFIEYSKQGYFPDSYNNGLPSIISNTNVLSSVTLDSTSTNIIYASGNISGQWNNQNIYVIDDNSVIPQNDSLVIEMGTQVLFDGFYSIEALGALVVNGTIQEPVKFTSKFQNQAISDWIGIQIYSSNSIIDNAIFEYCDSCISAYDDVTIMNSEFRHFNRHGIKAIATNSQILRNEFHSYLLQAVYTWWGTSNLDHSESSIECNYIHNGRLGISGTGRDKIKNNILVDLSGSTGIVAKFGFNTSADISNNIVKNIEFGITISDYDTQSYVPVIANNVIDGSVEAIRVDGRNASIKITNNIVINSDEGIVNYTSNELFDLTHNVFFNNNTNFSNLNSIIGLGQVVSTNINGDDCDPYFNLFKDPLISNYNDYTLQSTSPCINAGNSNYNQNIGLDQNLNCNSVSTLISSDIPTQENNIFPNPTSSDLNVTFINAKQVKNWFRIIDINGYLVKEISSESETVKINLSDLPPGIYIYELQSNSDIQRGKFVKE